jgi:putative protease
MPNDKKNNPVELLAPAGSVEKLEIAIHYGADAVYLAAKEFSLRNFSENFTLDELRQAVQFAHRQGVKVYIACNIYARNDDQPAIVDFLKTLGEIGPDAIIVADSGIFMLASKLLPQTPLHISTQANTTNYQSALFWQNLGAKRINLARELSLQEIDEITRRCDLEIEAFVHGAMCISYSGRCLLSSFMANRDSNRGMCSHPCRWEYAVVEEQRPGQYMPIAEDGRGTYIFNSKDLCMIEHIPEMIEAGIVSFKIEGRVKGINYLGPTVKIYREAIDTYFANPAAYRVKEDWRQELAKTNFRGYCTGFYFGEPRQTSPAYEGRRPADQIFIGKVTALRDGPGVNIEVRNKVFTGQVVEIIRRKGPARQDKINDILDEKGQSLSFAQPGSRVSIVLNNGCSPNDLIRRKVG